MRFGQGNNCWNWPKFFGIKFWLWRSGCSKNINFSVLQVIHVLTLGAFKKFEINWRVRCVIISKHIPKKCFRLRDLKTQSNVALLAPPGLSGAGSCLCNVLDCSLALIPTNVSGFCWVSSPRISNKQWRTDRNLKIENTMANRGLLNVENSYCRTKFILVLRW